MKLQVGDWVTIRTKDEILATLDRRGRLSGLPFMPQMFQYCGQRFRIYKSAHKTCDTVNKTGGRRVEDSVHLDLRCDGEAYGGCQAACLIFWHLAWLNSVSGEALFSEKINEMPLDVASGDSVSCTEKDVLQSTRIEPSAESETVKYRCQATQLPEYTTLLRWWNVRQYLDDLRSGNTTAQDLTRGFLYFFYRFIMRISFWQVQRIMIRVYDRFQLARGGVPYPRRGGKIAPGMPRPKSSLELQPGDLVRIKSYEEIRATLTTSGMYLGLGFDAEMVPYCGETYRVRSQVKQFLDEKTGEMIVLKTRSFILEGVWCKSKYSECRLACPRSIYAWWREIWLEKVPEDGELATLAEKDST